MKIDIKKMEICMAKKKLIKKDLATMSGLSANTITNIFNCKAVNPRTLGKLMEALECEAEDIIAREE